MNQLDREILGFVEMVASNEDCDDFKIEHINEAEKRISIKFYHLNNLENGIYIRSTMSNTIHITDSFQADSWYAITKIVEACMKVIFREVSE